MKFLDEILRLSALNNYSNNSSMARMSAFSAAYLEVYGQNRVN